MSSCKALDKVHLIHHSVVPLLPLEKDNNKAAIKQVAAFSKKEYYDS
jgi:hypothetical protein